MSLKLEYEQDFHQWIEHHIALLKEKRFEEIDLEHLIDELESMSKSDLRELRNRFVILIAHLLKWEYQLNQLQERWEAFTGKSWKDTIIEQRYHLVDLLEENPSFERFLADTIVTAHPKALKIAIKETGLPKSVFPNECPYTIEQLLDEDFYPEPQAL